MICPPLSIGPLRIDGMALGQGGLSDEPMWDNRVNEIRALKPAVIRLFLQECLKHFPLLGDLFIPHRLHFFFKHRHSCLGFLQLSLNHLVECC